MNIPDTDTNKERSYKSMLFYPSWNTWIIYLFIYSLFIYFTVFFFSSKLAIIVQFIPASKLSDAIN